MEEALRALLIGDTALAALVSTRIYWKDIPQAAAGDLIVMHRTTGGPDYTYSGESGFEAKRVQINTRASLVTGAWAIQRAVRGCLTGYRGTVGSIEFGGIFIDDEADLPTEDPAGPAIYRGTRSDITVWSRPVAPAS